MLRCSQDKASCIILVNNKIDSGDFNPNKINFKKVSFSQFKK